MRSKRRGERHKEIEHDKEIEQCGREAQNILIGEQVIHTLGRPDDRYDVQVRPLWEDHYRVNVFSGGGAASAKITNSYFVKVDDKGKIVQSSPTIKKEY